MLQSAGAEASTVAHNLWNLTEPSRLNSEPEDAGEEDGTVRRLERVKFEEPLPLCMENNPQRKKRNKFMVR